MTTVNEVSRDKTKVPDEFIFRSVLLDCLIYCRTVADPGGGSGGSGPPLSDLTLTTLRLKFLHRQDHISLFN